MFVVLVVLVLVNNTYTYTCACTEKCRKKERQNNTFFKIINKIKMCDIYKLWDEFDIILYKIVRNYSNF